MACPDFDWEHNPRLEIWRKSQDKEAMSNIHLQSYSCQESVSVFEEALSGNTVSEFMSCLILLGLFVGIFCC